MTDTAIQGPVADYDFLDPSVAHKRRKARLVTRSLLALLLLAAVFWAGAVAQKQFGEASSGTNAAPAGFPGGGIGGAPTGAARGAGAGAPAGPAAGPANASGNAAGRTAGSVTLIDGDSIYLTDTTGNVVKVKAGATTKITKTVDGSLGDLKPGQTVTVQGATGSDGTVAASTLILGRNDSAGRVNP